jgi:predicted  nucleic acid-binding Zn-ribbon protein
MASTKRKKEIFQLRNDGTWYKTDIIPIVRYAWDCSFGRVKSNKKAICKRGWNPLNKALLLHPLVVKTKMKPISVDDSDEAQLHDATINTPVRTTICIPNSKLIEQLHREDARRYGASGKAKAEQKHREDTKDMQGRLRKICGNGRITSTKLAAKGHYNINVEEMVDELKKKRDAAQKEEELRAQRRATTVEKRQNEYEQASKKLKLSQNDPETLTVGGMQACLGVLPGSSPVKTRKADMKEQLRRRLTAFGGEMPSFWYGQLKKPPTYNQPNTNDAGCNQGV